MNVMSPIQESFHEYPTCAEADTETDTDTHTQTDGLHSRRTSSPLGLRVITI